MSQESLTAHVDKARLLHALDKKIEAHEATMKGLRDAYNTRISELVAQKPMKGWLWWRRLKTEKEIEEDYSGEWYDPGYSDLLNIIAVGGAIYRLKEQRAVIEKDSVTNVRLPESDLIALKDFL